MKETWLVSACLFEIACRYSGRLASRRLSKKIAEDEGFLFIPVCPEQLSGLPTPRDPVEIQNGDGFDVLEGHAKVTTKDGVDFTKEFIAGAEAALAVSKITKVSRMVVQDESPSCSCSRIHNGSFSDVLVRGHGVTSAFLERNGVQVVSVEDFEQILTRGCEK